MEMNNETGAAKGILAPKGFEAAYTSAGIKKNNALDMALIYSETPCIAAGTFTRNRVFAAPVQWDRGLIQTSPCFNAIVVNAGVANACTGEKGLQDCKDTAEAVAKNIPCNPENVLICSTGVIGANLPMDKIKSGIEAMAKTLSSNPENGHGAAKAIMTTDTRPKEVSITVDIDGTPVTIGGMCKGAGMIHPNMATMLCYITTDCDIDKALLQKMTSAIVDDSFNMISVDGDTSTNDTAIVLANGKAENKIIDNKNESYETFKRALGHVCTELAKMIAGDGEGCTALIEATVCNAKTRDDARTLAKSIVTSSLTKAAVFGHDANWGRILAAMGYSGVDFDPEIVDIFVSSNNGRLQLVKDGIATDYSEDEATSILSGNPVIITADIKKGGETATAWGCDLTLEYVKINADYRS